MADAEALTGASRELKRDEGDDEDEVRSADKPRAVRNSLKEQAGSLRVSKAGKGGGTKKTVNGGGGKKKSLNKGAKGKNGARVEPAAGAGDDDGDAEDLTTGGIMDLLNAGLDEDLTKAAPKKAKPKKAAGPASARSVLGDLSPDGASKGEAAAAREAKREAKRKAKAEEKAAAEAAAAKEAAGADRKRTGSIIAGPDYRGRSGSVVAAPGGRRASAAGRRGSAARRMSAARYGDRWFEGAMPDASLGLSNEIMLEMGHYETFVLNDARPPATYRPDARDERRRKKHWQRTRIRAFESAGEAMIQFLRTMKDYPAEDGGGDGAGGVLTTGKLLGRLLQVAMRSAPENGGIFGNFGGVAPSDIVTVWLHEPKDGVLYTRWASKLPANIKKNARDYIKIKDGDGMAGAAFAAAAPSNTPDARMDPNYSDRVDRTTGYVTRSVLTLPFGAPGTAPIGVAQFINRVWSPDADEDSDADSEDDEGHATSSVLPFADPEADARVRVDETAFKIDDLAMPEHVETLAVRDGDATRAIHVIPYSARDEAAMTGLVDLFACVLTYAIEYHEARRGVAPGGDFTCLNDLVESKETSRIGIWTKRAREILFNRKSDEDEAAKVDDSDDEDEADSVGRAAASRRATNRGTISEFLTRSTSTFGRRESQRALLDRAPDEPAPQKPAHLQRQGGANREGARRSSISKFFAKKAADKADAPAGPPRGSQRRTSLSKFFAKNDGGAAPAAAPTASSRRRSSLSKFFGKGDDGAAAPAAAPAAGAKRRGSLSKLLRRASQTLSTPGAAAEGAPPPRRKNSIFNMLAGGAAPASPVAPDPFRDSPPAPLRRRGSLFAKEDVNPNKTTVENGKIRHTFSNQATLEVADVANTPQSPPRRL
ncbi:hypothetical protein AURANDRAFT_64833 [Aureococcus anophagefferens]|uniref:Uncharacterized protein n=1 Tax=Aureococcus anophagefferens TaxID=44056 RepID=F0YBX0_AURAN|nr:hypothetical protein AURANDRAFT_64833 [Aureococcus anophagefferens]EGB07496.1 hypothetical protein AURANDRAFT_64833 [Aureococcus anophagefferens]|eukprot:XP_009038108.1 hypothetical protein AURANDRAFT_64833 [Aureococcus anophagefferens]